MEAFLITDQFIREIIKSSTIDEYAKQTFYKSAIENKTSLSQYFFEIFTYYIPAYEQPELQGHRFEYDSSIKESFGPLIKHYADDRNTSVRVIDPFDALYNRSLQGTETVFESELFDLLYNQMSDTFGEDHANNWFTEVVQLLEYVVVMLELSFMKMNKKVNSDAFKLFISTSGNSLSIFIH